MVPLKSAYGNLFNIKFHQTKLTLPILKFQILQYITDKKYSDFAKELNQRWKMLCRKIPKEVEKNPERYSLLYLPHPVVVPGGRFREVS
jgi:neutral trehalase